MPVSEIKVALLNGQFRTVSIDIESTTLDLKQQLASEAPVEQQSFFFRGKAMQNSDRLCDYGVEDTSTVYLMLRAKPVTRTPSGGVATPITTPNSAELQHLLDCHEISIAEAADLEPLKTHDIIFILDDSSSMNTSDAGGPTRWKELQTTATSLIELATCLDPDGTDLYFLNRPSVESVSNPEDDRVRECFKKPPSGRTPLTEKVVEVVAKRKDGARPLLLVIVSDGEPNGNGGIEKFKSTVKSMIKDDTKNVRFQIMACTDDKKAMAWLNGFDAEISGLDVCDDYHNERKEVLEAGRKSNFSRGDWVMKALLGPISSKYDDWDKPSTPSAVARTPSGSPVMDMLARSASCCSPK